MDVPFSHKVESCNNALSQNKLTGFVRSCIIFSTIV